MEIFNLGGRVLLIDTALAAESINVGQFVNPKGVLLVEGDAIEALASSNSLCRSGVFNEGKSTLKSVQVGSF